LDPHFPHTPVTRKPQDVKMGSGKGNPEFFVAKVKAGTIMFEMDGVAESVAREAMRLAAHKLPVKTTFIVKEEA
jgi:large subunit ribosomal protein L16